MPLYEYRCNHCRRKFTWLHGVVASKEKPTCPHCGAADYRKLVSRVARARSEEEIFDSFDPDSLGDLEDPRQARQLVKKLSKEFGEEVGEDLEEEFDAAMEEESMAEGKDINASSDDE